MLANLFTAQHPTVSVMNSLLRSLHIEVTQTTVKDTLLNHPDYPSLLSLSDTLHKWKINNVAAQIPKENLGELPLPFIAHVYAKEGEQFVLVTAVTEITVKYVKDDSKKIVCAREEFVRGWSGVALLAEKGDTSGEKNYSVNRRKERRTALKIPAILFFSLLLITSAVFSFYGSVTIVTTAGYALFLLLTLAGAVITSLLLWYEIDKANPALQKICTAGAKTNCNAVLSSKQSKLFSWLSWSEVGFFYFTVSFIVLLIAGFTLSLSLLSLIALLSLLALPYVVFSVYYQWRVVKQWCVLCVSIQALLLLQFVTSLTTDLLSASALPSINTILLFVVIASTIAGGWFLLKPLLLKNEEAKRTQRELIRLKANPQIWEALLAKQKKIEYAADGLGIVLGNPQATNTLIKVCNPYCGPCAKAHPEIEKLLEENDNLKVQIIFTATTDKNDLKAPPVKHLLAIAEKENKHLIKQALEDWYLADKKDYNLFATKYPMNGELKKQDAKLEAMRTWCDETKIAFTPTIFVNGYQLPEAYEIKDLQNFL